MKGHLTFSGTPSQCQLLSSAYHKSRVLRQGPDAARPAPGAAGSAVGVVGSRPSRSQVLHPMAGQPHPEPGSLPAHQHRVPSPHFHFWSHRQAAVCFFEPYTFRGTYLSGRCVGFLQKGQWCLGCRIADSATPLGQTTVF